MLNTTIHEAFKVLLADPSETFCGNFSAMFSKNGTQIHTCGNGLTLIDEACHFHPDFLIVNTALPSLSGLAAIDIIREKLRTDLPVAVILHSDSESLQAETVKRNVLFHFIAPVVAADFQDLMVKLKEKIWAA